MKNDELNDYNQQKVNEEEEERFQEIIMLDSHILSSMEFDDLIPFSKENTKVNNETQMESEYYLLTNDKKQVELDDSLFGKNNNLTLLECYDSYFVINKLFSSFKKKQDDGIWKEIVNNKYNKIFMICGDKTRRIIVILCENLIVKEKQKNRVYIPIIIGKKMEFDFENKMIDYLINYGWKSRLKGIIIPTKVHGEERLAIAFDILSLLVNNYFASLDDIQILLDKFN